MTPGRALLSTLLGTLLLATTGMSFAQPKVVEGYDALGVTAGEPGGTLALSISDTPQTFFYYGAIDANHQTLNMQMFDGLVE